MQGIIIPGFSPETNKNFMKGLAPTIFIGTLIGAFPKVDLITKRKFNQGVYILLLGYSGILVIFLTINAIMKVQWFFRNFDDIGGSFIGKLGAVTGVTYDCALSFVYAYHLFLSSRFPKIILKFNSIAANTGVSGCTGFFPWFCLIITSSCLISGIAENLVYDVDSVLQRLQKNPNSSALQMYFLHCFNHWLDPFPGEMNTPIVTVVFVFLNKIGKWGWLFMDTVVIILCHSLALQFKALNRKMQQDLINCQPPARKSIGNKAVFFTINAKHTGSQGLLTWDLVYQRFRDLVDLTNQIEEYVAPLIYACYLCVGQILVIIFAWIGSDISKNLTTTGKTIQVYFGSLYYVFRVGVLTYYASEVSFESQKILKSVERCDPEEYGQSVERMERKLIGNPVGIHLFGSFLMSRHFIVAISGFIFTTEIVLLQMALANK